MRQKRQIVYIFGFPIYHTAIINCSTNLDRQKSLHLTKCFCYWWFAFYSLFFSLGVCVYSV